MPEPTNRRRNAIAWLKERFGFSEDAAKQYLQQFPSGRATMARPWADSGQDPEPMDPKNDGEADRLKLILEGGRSMLKMNYENSLEELKKRHNLSEEDVQLLRDLPTGLYSKHFDSPSASSGPNLDTHWDRPVTLTGETDTWSNQPLNP